LLLFISTHKSDYCIVNISLPIVQGNTVQWRLWPNCIHLIRKHRDVAINIYSANLLFAYTQQEYRRIKWTQLPELLSCINCGMSRSYQMVDCDRSGCQEMIISTPRLARIIDPGNDSVLIPAA
jgi:hypothetical protein